MNESITNPSGEQIDYSFEPREKNENHEDWIVVLGHGVTGNKDRPLIAATAEALRAIGFDTLRFSFSGNGNSQGDFRKSNISKGVTDLGAVIDAVSHHYKNICYIGHSMGAAIGVILASKDKRINRLVSLAGMVDTRKFAETEFGAETPDKGLMWEDESCPLSSEFMHDLQVTIQSVAPKAKDIHIPWLLIHGTADDVVLPDDSQHILHLKGNAVNLITIEDADHSFSQPEHLNELQYNLTSWMRGQC